MEDEYRIDGLTVKEYLLALAENGNRKFTEQLHPGVSHILGVRVPQLRKLAVRIARGDWESYLASADTFYMEERMLQGLVLGYIRPDTDIDRYLQRVTCFVWNIGSWSVCDTFKFAGGKQYFSAHRERFWEYLLQWMHTTEEYAIRFGVVMSMRYFMDASHIPLLLSAYDHISHEGYYVRMAIAWAIAECMVHFPSETMQYLQSSDCHLDTFTYCKAIQKIRESYRIDETLKQKLAVLRERNRQNAKQ